MLVLDCCHGPVTKEFSDHAVGSYGSDRRGLLSGESHQAGLLWAPAIFEKILSLRDNKYTSNCFFKEPELYLPTKLPWAPLRPRPSAEQSVVSKSPRAPRVLQWLLPLSPRSFSPTPTRIDAGSQENHPHKKAIWWTDSCHHVGDLTGEEKGEEKERR